MEVIEAQTLNFKPNFKFSRLNFFGGPPSQLGCALGSLGQSLARVKIWGCNALKGPKYCVPKNVNLGESICTSITFYMWTKVHQVSFVQPGRGCSWSTTFQIFDVHTRSGDFHDQSRKLSEIAPKFERFFDPPKFYGVGLPKIVRMLSPLPRDTSAGKVFMRIFPLVPKL